jgi:hypothetical protein
MIIDLGIFFAKLFGEVVGVWLGLTVAFMLIWVAWRGTA